MALTRLWRRSRIEPMPRRDFAVNVPPNAAFDDDYLVAADEPTYQGSPVVQAAKFLQVVMIFVIAALSLAVFWIVGTMLNIL
jgi:hypothetical protein